MNQTAAAAPVIPADPAARMAALVSLCKRRGFVYPSSEIYGGLNGFWDFGPLGSLLKNAIRDAWWRDMVLCPPMGPDGRPLSIVGLDSSIILNPRTWVASGHVGGFNDLMTDCRESKARYRADHLLCIEMQAEKAGNVRSLGMLSVMSGDDALADLTRRAEKLVKKTGGGTLLPITLADARPFTTLSEAEQSHVLAPEASAPGTLTAPRQFNLMFHTFVGTQQSDDSKAYLRPETAQGIFLNFKNVADTSRVQVPFGIAQVGKAFRNEVTPRNFIFRSREFEQMEMEFFCPPDESQKWYEFWVATRLQWWADLGLNPAHLRRREHEKDELSHYSSATADVEYLYPFTEPDFGELEGIAHRGNFDLTQHQTHSKTKLSYFDDGRKESYLPHVIEPASGLTRGVLAILCDSYRVDASRPSPEYLALPPTLAPVKLGIFPLVNKEGMPEMAEKMFLDLRRRFPCQFDEKQSIGKRYARMDEIGTPFCITVDGQSLEDQTITLRDRDTGQQERIAADQILPRLSATLR